MNVQVFIHKYYETIKLVLLGIIMLSAFFILYGQGQTARQLAEDTANETIAREEAVANLLEADQKKADQIINNQEKQTKLIICLLATHGANVVITPEDEEECRILVDEAVDSVQTSPQAQQQSTTSQKTNTEPGATSEDDKPSTQPEQDEPSLIDEVLDPIFNLLRSIVSRRIV